MRVWIFRPQSHQTDNCNKYSAEQNNMEPGYHTHSSYAVIHKIVHRELSTYWSGIIEKKSKG